MNVASRRSLSHAERLQLTAWVWWSDVHLLPEKARVRFRSNCGQSIRRERLLHSNQSTWNSHFGRLKDNGLFSPNFQTPSQTPFLFLVTFCVSRRRRKMYCVFVCLCVCLSVCPRPFRKKERLNIFYSCYSSMVIKATPY